MKQVKAVKRKKGEKEAPLSPEKRAVVLKSLQISEQYHDKKFTEKFRKELSDGLPFPAFFLENFVANPKFSLGEIEKELQEFPRWNRKENDLYSLYQTTDFKNIPPTEQPFLFTFREFLVSTVRPWLQTVSGVKLTKQVDITGSCYAHTDGLLPHNDQIETRRFAFVYYLTDAEWSEADGGALHLFNCDEHSQPTTIARRILPLRNSLVLFEVSEKSWHQVEEVMAEDKPRLSINGWFHSDRRLPEIVPQVEKIVMMEQTKGNGNNLFKSLLNPTYFEAARQSQIQSVFEEKSEVSLYDFLQPAQHGNLVKEFSRAKFNQTGPRNKRCVYRLAPQSLKNTAQAHKFIDFLKSKTAAEYFSTVTGCELNDCSLSISIERVQSGCYTVVGDEEVEEKSKQGYTLDVHLFIGDGTSWPEDAGGLLFYVGKDDDQELIRVAPQLNSAAIVFKEPGVFSFLKYATKKALQPFYMITVSYYGVKVDEDSENEDEEDDGMEDEGEDDEDEMEEEEEEEGEEE